MKLGYEAGCPCGSGIKHRECCSGKVDWEKLLQSRPSEIPLHLSVRGRNLAFLECIGDVLQLDHLPSGGGDWNEVKRAITVDAVAKINQSIVALWPQDLDIGRALARHDGRQLGFFSGDYRPERMLDSVGRHLLYADVVGMGDPFLYPISLRGEYNPLLQPEKHLTNTAKSVLFWLKVAPLIDDRLVEIFRLPADFDPRLNSDNAVACQELVDRHPELRAAVSSHARDRADNDNEDNREWLMLLQSDSKLESLLREQPSISEKVVRKAMEGIRRRREDHPFFMGTRTEVHYETTGASVYDALQIAKLTGAYLLTDLDVRWKQIAFAAEGNVESRTRVAHGIDSLKLPMAKHLDLEFARRIRQEGRLEDVRGHLDRIMRASRSDHAMSDEESRSFQHELKSSVAEAKDEYAKIDRDLLMWAGAETVAALCLGTGSLSIALGAVVAGGANLARSHWARRTFSGRYPAAMFMGLPSR